MPFLILSGQLCPPGIEGTLFALFMSINNLGATVSSFVGAWLASNLNISSGSFDNLLIGVVIQFFSSFIPLAFLFLIPKEATGLSAQIGQLPPVQNLQEKHTPLPPFSQLAQYRKIIDQRMIDHGYSRIAQKMQPHYSGIELNFCPWNFVN